MRVPLQPPDPVPEMNTTPLIDVMLVLLVMIMMTIPIMTNSTLMDLPRGDTAADAAPLPILKIDVDFLGIVRVDGQPVALEENNPVQRARAIDAALMNHDPANLRVHVEPDGVAPYAPVVEIMAALQRGGFDKVGFVGNHRFVKS
ncbi:biopolymer transporter ExbD [Pacificimonas sp. WHA3]|uniref:Biopolymer transporter ExbD n=1 Tax=Pacificimonas pallii TaxID=2827236 RepID=A0ABS6SAP0_9SPHN|nr:biopolymer transporter ExbD [Pacificimonas pallii]MBV7255394.1 biopolymer transporter ExbD [Pacificimonas pallii]